MNLLKKIALLLFCVSVVLNFFPEFWHNLHLQIYHFIDFLPLMLIIGMYLVNSKRYNAYYIIGVVLSFLGLLASKYYLDYYDYIIVVYGLSLISFILLAHKDIFRITTQSIVIFSIPFLIVMVCIYLFFTSDINFISKAPINFYSLIVGFFLFFTGTLYYNQRSKVNLLFLLSSICLLFAAFFNGFDLSSNSFVIERFVNILFITHHLLVLEYVLLKEDTSILNNIFK